MQEIDRVKEQVDRALNGLLPAESVHPGRIHAAMRYSVFAGGKRLRPFLAWLGYRAAGGDPSDPVIYKIGAALEMIHTYTLIHDDLPCMDDDDLRRGRPTCHRQFDEATAVLAGDALYAQAFIVLAEYGNLAMMKLIAQMSGSLGIVGGQIVDIMSEGQPIDESTLLYIHTHKTAVFISAALQCGCLALAQPPIPVCRALKDYGDRIGLAFQIVDDILDIIGDEKTLGKPIGSDTELSKATFPSLYGLEQSRVKARNLIDQAQSFLPAFGDSAELFAQLSEFIFHRVQ
ncbi:MAG: polyprenyl synthetase family protein [Candidatus Delongbacteria bacterium]|nr:polyprenyl synthetase family protein [Candidatus Delongbacteria bacterium]